MWDAFSSGFLQALGGLGTAAFAYCAYYLGQESGKKRGWRAGGAAALGGCLILAAVVASSLGQGSCKDLDSPLYGSCIERDDGYTPTNEQIEAEFFRVLFLLGVPTALGVKAGTKRR